MPISKNLVRVDACTKQGAFDQLDYGQDAAIKLLQYFEKLFKIEYPLTKLGKDILRLLFMFYKTLLNSLKLYSLKIILLCRVLNTVVGKTYFA